MRHGSVHPAGQQTNLAVCDGRIIRAYVFGIRAPQRDAYIVDEYGFNRNADQNVAAALLRAAAGDLRRIVGWLPPGSARHVLPKVTLRRRKRAIFMVAPLSLNGEHLLKIISDPASSDFCWATDHV